MAAREQAEAEQEEAFRQQTEATRQAQAEKSDRALAADKEFARMITAMETIGGAGSQSEARLGQEIQGTKALDLARIEGNRDRQVQALQSRAKAAFERGKAGQAAAAGQFLGTLVDLGSGVAGRQETLALREEERAFREQQARGFTQFPLGGSS